MSENKREMAFKYLINLNANLIDYTIAFASVEEIMLNISVATKNAFERSLT